MTMAPVTPPPPAPAPTPVAGAPLPTDVNNALAGSAGGGAAAKGKEAGLDVADGSFAAQVELMKTNMEFMIAMAWLNFALAVTSKINGR